MAIMKCPKCGGSGEIWQNPDSCNPSTAVVPNKTVCPSCGGTGYVTDTPAPPPPVEKEG